MNAIKQYRCETCGRVTKTRLSRRTRCPLLEVLAPHVHRKPYYRCNGHLVRIVVKRVKASQAAPDVKLAKARIALKRNLARLRRAATSVKKWERRVVLLEKLVAASVPVVVPYTGTGRHARHITLDENEQNP